MRFDDDSMNVDDEILDPAPVAGDEEALDEEDVDEKDVDEDDDFDDEDE
jgi:hypothetical protein